MSNAISTNWYFLKKKKSLTISKIEIQCPNFCNTGLVSLILNSEIQNPLKTKLFQNAKLFMMPS